MSDVKNYIVQYDIRANTEQAAAQLRAIMESIAGVEGPMKTLQQTLGTLNSTLTQLKSNQNLAFAPTIDTTSFDRKLKAMQVSVKTAADEMAAAINRALQGNTAVGKAAKNSLGNVLGPRTAKDIQKDIAAYKEKINQIMGAPDKKTGKRHFAFADLNDEHKAQVKALRQQISNDSKLLKEAEKLERQNAAVQTKSEKTAQKAASKPTVATKAQAARLTNVTPAIIREWGKVFGNTKAKSLTVSIYGKADGPNGAITVINQVKTILGELGALGKFDIMPKPNAAAFTEIESKLSSLAALSKSVMAPFTGDTTKKQGKSNTLVGLTKDEQKKLEQARASATDYKKKIDDVQRKLYANQQRYDQQPTPALKGQITRGTKLLQQYKLGLSTAQYDIQQLQEKATPAVQPTTKIAPLTINVVGNLTGINNVGKEFPVNVIGQIQKLQPPANAEIPVAVKITASQVNQSLKAIPRPELPVSIKLMWNKGAIGKQEQLKAIQDKVPPINLDLNITPALEKLETFIGQVKASSPQTINLKASGSGSASATNGGSGSTTTTGGSNKNASQSAVTSKMHNSALPFARSQGQLKAVTDNIGFFNKASQITGIPLSPNLSTFERLTLFNEAINQIGKADEKIPWALQDERNKLEAARGNELNKRAEGYKKSYARHKNALRMASMTSHQSQINTLRAQAYNSFLPFVNGQGQMNELMKYRRFFKEAVALSGINPTANMSSAQKLAYLKTTSEWIAANNRQIPYQLTDEISKLQNAISKETEMQKQQKSVTSISRHQRQADALRTKASNALLPFAKNQSQLNELIKYRKYFKAASVFTGITPRANMSGAEKLWLLKSATEWMKISNQQVPFQFVDEIKKLEAESKALATQTKQERKQKTLARGAARHQMHVAQLSNAVLPFVQNKEQLNTVVKNWKYFSKAMTTTGITPVQGISSQNMLKYLQSVSQLMRKANVQIPMQLQTAINKLQAQVLQATQAATQLASATTAATKATSKMQTVRIAEKPVSSYDRIRKWAYPFTGNTSFGATTPMAVDMAKGMGVMFAVGGAMSAVGNSFSEAIEYQNTMRTTNAILKNGTDTYTPSGFASMERTVRDVGIKTKFSAPEVASAARFLAMAGFDIEKIKHSIQPIADLALIGDTDLGETADKMTNIMTTFNIAGEKVREAVNIMTTTATRSNTDLMMLAESAKYGGGVASLYGKNDPNLFADTMALFGIMGNAGIQASSAGTALRMMYQNIFKPNKNQQAVLDMLDKVYGIKTINEDDSYRSMSDILTEIARRVPQNEMAKVVGNLFRITAQPGAAAALNAAAQEDGTDASQVASGVDAVSEFVGKNGLSSLVELMLANRASVTSNISQNIALEKQNTIKGLWAQVTSTFTEGILKAFEANTGYFEEMLGNLRDYLARPETAQLIQKLFDMIVSIGKMMAKFVKVWVWFYEKFEPIVKGWIWAQMFFTQVGSLITPIVGAISVLDRLRSTLFAIAGVEMTTTATKAAAISNVAGNLIGSATNVMGNMRGTKALASRYRNNTGRADKFEGLILSEMALLGFYGAAANDMVNRRAAASSNGRLKKIMQLKEKSEVYAENIINERLAVRERAKRIYGTWPRVSRGFMSAFTFDPFVGLGNWFKSLKSLFSGLMVALAKAAGLLVNPFTLATGAAIGLGYGIYRLSQYTKGTTEAQIQARKKLEDEYKKSFSAENERHKGNYDFFSQNGLVTSRMADYQEEAKEVKEKYNKYASSYSYLFSEEAFSKDGASRKTNQYMVDMSRQRFANDRIMRLALTEDEYKKLLGGGVVIASEKFEQDMLKLSKNMPFNAGNSLNTMESAMIFNAFGGEAIAAQNEWKRQATLAVKNEGAKDSRVLQAQKQIVELYKKYGRGAEFVERAKSIISSVANPYDINLYGDEYITKENFNNPNFDWSNLKSYVWAGYNLLNAEIEGLNGSITASLEAQERLKKLVPHSDEWYRTLSNVLNNFRIIRTIGFNGKEFNDIELLIKALPNGNLDFSNILQQLRDKIEGFKANTKLFIEIADQAYQMLYKEGLVKDNSVTARKEFIKKNMGNWAMSEDEIELYNNSETDNAYGSIERHGQHGSVSIPMEQIGWVEEMNERNQRAFGYLLDQVVKDPSQKTSSDSGTVPNPNPNPTSGNGTADPTKQDAYESKYTASAARPTQIVLNIDKMANFDRTTIAANAEERDMMLALEQKMAETVYRILAEAMNNASSVMRT